MLSRVPVDPQAYRDAMARYAGHVQIVTATLNGERRGVTVTAACSVSDNPGTVLVCLNASNPKNDIFRAAGHFALNTLSAGQKHIADAFSGLTGVGDDERFRTGEWDRLVTGAPVLAGASAVFDCRLIDIKTVHTHMVLFGEVAGLRIGQGRSGLIYHARRYHELDGMDDEAATAGREEQ